jgi:hypothetical protein
MAIDLLVSTDAVDSTQDLELRDAHVKSIAGNLQLECAEALGKLWEDSPRLKSNGHMNHQTWQCLKLNSCFF